MAFSASSYFGGVATVLATVALGFGGGVAMTDALVGNSDLRGMSKMAQRAEPTATVAPVVSTPVVSTVAAPVEKPASAAPQLAAQPQAAPAPLAAPQAVQEQPLHQAAMARSQEAALKKALTAERRKAERRLWAERRKQKIDEFNAAAVGAKDAERDRDPMMRSYAAQSQPFSVFRMD